MTEVQVDTLAGMTHHFGGHSKGNFASLENKGIESNPKVAALQGLEKMKCVHEYGVPQVILPPQDRPHFNTLHHLGIDLENTHSVDDIYNTSPQLLIKLCSSAFIWTANAATAFPSSDTYDQKVHFHIANLSSQLHRNIEAQDRYQLFKTIFSNTSHFRVYPPQQSQELRDEGAANHTRLSKGLHLFVYGDENGQMPHLNDIPRRQSKVSQEVMALSSKLNSNNTLYLQQSDAALKAGVFHNDVAAVGFENHYICHESAYRGGFCDIDDISKAYQELNDEPLNLITVSEPELSMNLAVKSYLLTLSGLNQKMERSSF